MSHVTLPPASTPVEPAALTPLPSTIFDADQVAALRAPLDESAVKVRRSGDGKDVSYIDGWHAVEEANRVFGYGGWDQELVHVGPAHEPHMIEPKPGRTNGRKLIAITYAARVRVTVWDRTHTHKVVREDVGTCDGVAATLAEAAQIAIKGAVTDGFKRATKSFGNTFGLALYDKEQRNVGPRRNMIKARREALPAPPQTAFADIERAFRAAGSRPALKQAGKDKAGVIQALPEEPQAYLRTVYEQCMAALPEAQSAIRDQAEPPPPAPAPPPSRYVQVGKMDNISRLDHACTIAAPPVTCSDIPPGLKTALSSGTPDSVAGRKWARRDGDHIAALNDVARRVPAAEESKWEIVDRLCEEIRNADSGVQARAATENYRDHDMYERKVIEEIGKAGNKAALERTLRTYANTIRILDEDAKARIDAAIAEAQDGFGHRGKRPPSRPAVPA